MKELAAANGDLTDADLKKFSGGISDDELIVSATATTISVATAGTWLAASAM